MTSFNTLTAFAARDWNADRPRSVEFRMEFTQVKEAVDFAAGFAKSHQMRTIRVTAGPDAPVPIYWAVVATIHLGPVKGNERNETGIKRYRAIGRRANKLGYLVHWVTPGDNWYETVEEFEAAIAE
jgi:hypothetical protein